jgi:hypothetical protein
MKNAADVTGGKPIAILLQSISGVSAINPSVAFYDIHGGKREVLVFYFIPDTIRDTRSILRSFYGTLSTYQSSFIPKGVAEASQILRRDAHALPKLLSCGEHCRRDQWQAHRRPIAVHLRCKCY